MIDAGRHPDDEKRNVGFLLVKIWVNFMHLVGECQCSFGREQLLVFTPMSVLGFGVQGSFGPHLGYMWRSVLGLGLRPGCEWVQFCHKPHCRVHITPLSVPIA